MQPFPQRISVAPMMGWTDRHFRFFMRQISARATLYSEMLAPEAIVLGKKERHTAYHPAEHPVVFQLGGSDPKMLAQACQQLERLGYDEVNLNVGCPSKTGQHRPYGAHLFPLPHKVKECLTAMQEAVAIPISIKTRIGVDQNEGYEPLAEFVGIVEESGCRRFTIHARKAWLKGLSTRENREIPPLRYDLVYRLKREFPHLTISLNGAINDWEAGRAHLNHVDGLMIGRRAYKDPYSFARVDQEFYQDTRPSPDRVEVLRRCLPYVEDELAKGTRLRDITRHMVSLFRHVPDASQVRKCIALETYPREANLDTFKRLIEVAEQLQEASRMPQATAVEDHEGPIRSQ